MKPYEIVLFVVFFSFVLFAKVWHVSYNGTGNATQGTTWAQSVTLDTIQVAALTAKDTLYVRADGEHVLHANFDKTATDGAATTMIVFMGVKSGTTHEGAAIDTSDWIKDTNRVLINCGTSYTFKVGTYYLLRGLSFYGATSNVCYPEARSVIYNCRFNNNYGSANTRNALSLYTNMKLINSEIISANNNGLNSGGNTLIDNCVFINIKNGTGGVAITTSGDNIRIMNCLFDSCRIGLNTVNRDGTQITNCVFHGCTKAVAGTTDFNTYVSNNIFSHCDTGAIMTTNSNSNYFTHNARHSAPFFGIDTAGLYCDQYAVQADPLFTADGTNFSLQTNSPCKNKGLSVDSTWAH